MAQLYEYVKMAIDNIRANKGRSFLTMLGIIIGISSVIMIMSVGGGAKTEMSDALSAIAGGQLYISVNDSGDGSAEYITPGDMEAIKEKVPHVKGVTPSDSMMGTLLSPKGSFDVIASTGTADLEYTHNPEMKYGHYFTDSDVEAMNLVAVIGQRDAIKMFGTDDVVGMSVEATIYNVTHDITICGVIQEEQSDSAMMDAMMYGTTYVNMYMPYTANYAFGYELDEFYSIYIISEGSAYSKEVGNESMRLLENRHHAQGKDMYFLQDADAQIAQITSVLDMITAFIALVAAIAPAGGRNRRHEYHAGFRHRADPGNRNPQSPGSENRLHHDAVPGGIGDYHLHRRRHRHPAGPLRCLRHLFPAGAWHLAGYQCGNDYHSDAVLLRRGHFLRNLSGEKGRPLKPHRGASEKLNGIMRGEPGQEWLAGSPHFIKKKMLKKSKFVSLACNL